MENSTKKPFFPSSEDEAKELNPWKEEFSKTTFEGDGFDRIAEAIGKKQ
jgi:hypothetical protein